jgi:hypothetical protein
MTIATASVVDVVSASLTASENSSVARRRGDVNVGASAVGSLSETTGPDT